jgi:hypothetical protein
MKLAAITFLIAFFLIVAGAVQAKLNHRAKGQLRAARTPVGVAVPD